MRDKIKKELKDINILKKTNIEYLNIINKIKDKVNKEKEDEISDDEYEYDNKNKMIINEKIKTYKTKMMKQILMKILY